MADVPAAGAMGGSGSGGISLDGLIALNDEMVALVRAGVPLERGLLGVGAGLRGRLGALTRALGERLSRGESLPQALAAEGDSFPPVYRAMVEAGLRTGRLTTALEGLARYARSYAEMRRAVGLALLYPMIVLLLAGGLAVGFAVFMAPRFVAAFGSLGVASPMLVPMLRAMGATAPYWGPIAPIVVLLAAAWWIGSGRAAYLQPGWSGRILRRLPWAGTMLDATEAANFADLLALLVEHQVPLPEAIGLAAGASGDPALRRSCAEVAEALRRGELAGSIARGAAGPLPPLLRWIMAGGPREATLISALRHAAEAYRRRALNRAEMIRVFLPVALVLVIGAGATLACGLLLFVPISALWQGLALE